MDYGLCPCDFRYRIRIYCPKHGAWISVSIFFCTDISRTLISASMADEKGHRPLEDEKISAPSLNSSGKIGDMPTQDIMADDPTQEQYYRQFEENGVEWRADFEKKLKRKVDLRLIPLLVRGSLQDQRQ